MIYTEVTETVQNGDFGAERYPPYVLQSRPAGLKICAKNYTDFTRQLINYGPAIHKVSSECYTITNHSGARHVQKKPKSYRQSQSK
jgi:hypothetical protein